MLECAALCLPHVVGAEVSDRPAISELDPEASASKQIADNLVTTENLLTGLDVIARKLHEKAEPDKSANADPDDFLTNLDGLFAEDSEEPEIAVNDKADKNDDEDPIESALVVRSAEILIETTQRPDIRLLAETSGACASNLEQFNSMELSHDLDSPDSDLLFETTIDPAPVDQGIMDRFLCHVGGFDYSEPGFSCWISCCRCPGDACRNVSPWSPPPTAIDRRMCEPSMAGIMQALIDEARSAEVERRRVSSAKDARIAAAWADARPAAAVAAAGAPASAAAGRSSLKRALANGGGAHAGGGKRGRGLGL